MTIAAALGLALVAAPAGADAAAPSGQPQETYDTTIELLNRASAADRVARDRDGWSGTLAMATTDRNSRNWTCCASLRRMADRWSERRMARAEYEVNLRAARYRLAGSEPGETIVGTPSRVYLQTERTRDVRRAVRVAGRPKAEFISSSAADPIPILFPGELYADSTLGLLPSAMVAGWIGMPNNVTRLERIEQAGATTYRGSLRRLGTLYRVSFEFRGNDLETATLSTGGRTLLRATWRYARPAVTIPGQPKRVGARTFRAAYAFANLPDRARKLVRQQRWVVRKALARRPDTGDRAVERYLRWSVREFARSSIGPQLLVFSYRYEKVPHGARVTADGRFGTRSRTITWDAERQRVRLSKAG